MSTKGSLWAGLEPAHPPAFDNDISQHRVYAYKKKQRSYQQERHISILGGVFFSSIIAEVRAFMRHPIKTTRYSSSVN